jgi:hypothetical protein
MTGIYELDSKCANIKKRKVKHRPSTTPEEEKTRMERKEKAGTKNSFSPLFFFRR